MPIKLVLTLLFTSLFLFVLTTIILKKGRIPEKYSLLWYAFSLILLLVAIFPNLFIFISKLFGFQVISNLVVGLIIMLLILLTMALTVIISGQKKKTTLLIQEVSILKKELDDVKKQKK